MITDNVINLQGQVPFTIVPMCKSLITFVTKRHCTCDFGDYVCDQTLFTVVILLHL